MAAKIHVFIREKTNQRQVYGKCRTHFNYDAFTTTITKKPKGSMTKLNFLKINKQAQEPEETDILCPHFS